MTDGTGVNTAAALRFRLFERLRRLRNGFRLLGLAVADTLSYARHSSLGGPIRSKDHYFAALTMYYHAIEKGMALPSPRPLFGKATIARILTTLKLYAPRFGFGQAGRAAVNTLARYVEFNHVLVQSDPYLDYLRDELNGLRKRPEYADCKESGGGVDCVTCADILRDAKCDLAAFFASRHSIREFSSKPVDIDLISQAAAMAQRTPSVCNRQPWRAYVVTNKQSIETILSYQNGNKGFGDKVDKLIVVVGDATAFVSSEERYEQWIDSGMFAMSLVYALHSLGLGTCCLNWCASRSADQALRRELGMKDAESAAVLIAVGNLPDSFRVCHSPRKPLEDVLVVR